MPFSWLDRLRPPLLLVLVLGLVAITRPAHATETAGPASAFTDLPLAEATARAAAEGKLLLLYFTATWCAPCRQMEATTWRDPTVLAHLRDRAIVVKCDSDLAKDLASEPWMKAGFDKLLLDPPRAGAAEVLAQLPLKGIGRIVYVSCHPGSLARDAGFLVKERGFKLVAAGAMDMFPQTAHVESIALFER